MPYNISLTTEDEQYDIIVAEASFTDTGITFIGLDPSLYPAEIRDSFQFFSKRLTAQLETPDEFDNITVTPTTDELPTPDTGF